MPSIGWPSISPFSEADYGRNALVGASTELCRVTPGSAAAMSNKGGALARPDERILEAPAAAWRPRLARARSRRVRHTLTCRRQRAQGDGAPRQALPSYEEVIKRRGRTMPMLISIAAECLRVEAARRSGIELRSGDRTFPEHRVLLSSWQRSQELAEADEAVSSYTQAIALNPANVSAYPSIAPQTRQRDLERPGRRAGEL